MAVASTKRSSIQSQQTGIVVVTMSLVAVKTEIVVVTIHMDVVTIEIGTTMILVY